VNMGVVTGDILVNGIPRGRSFQRKTGYVQQQDIHLSTATVREALRFSAVLRQPATVSKEEKFAYVEEVISLLEMEAYAEAVVGIPGEGQSSVTSPAAMYVLTRRRFERGATQTPHNWRGIGRQT